MPTDTALRVLPVFDADELAAAQRRYVDAWASASRIMNDATQAVWRRQADFSAASARRFWSAPAMPAARPDDQRRPDWALERMTDLFEVALAHFHELAGIMLQAQTESLNALAGSVTTHAEMNKRSAA